MKLLQIIIFTLTIILFLPVIKADLSCQVTTRASCSDTIILAVKNDTGGFRNAHAQTPTFGTYDYVICCNANTISQDVTAQCIDNSSVFTRLSSEDDAHVEVPTQNNYPEEVCIHVTNRQTQCTVHQDTCPPNKECIYSLASSEIEANNLTNAHINADCDPSYQTRVCCGFNNREPELIQVYIQPNTSVTTNITLQGFCQASDDDLDDLRYNYTWFLNDEIFSQGQTNFFENLELVNVANISTTNTQRGQNWTLQCIANDATLQSTPQNSTTITIINAPPTTPNLISPENNDTTFTQRFTLYNWTPSTDADLDPITYHLQVARDQQFSILVTNQQGIEDTFFQVSTPQDFDTYYWRVRAFDGEDYSDWSQIFNYTLVTSLIITPIQNEINFGTLNISQQISTESNTPQPLQFQNEGNIEADLRNITTNTPLFQQANLGTTNWQIKARQSNNFNEQQSTLTWLNIQNNIPNTIKELNWLQNQNNITFDISVTVPETEPPGARSSIINFVWGIST